MNLIGKKLLITAGVLTLVSLSANVLLWSRYNPDRAMLRFGNGKSIRHSDYQAALEAAAGASEDMSGPLLLAHSESTPVLPSYSLVANPTHNSLWGRIVQVADADLPYYYAPRRPRIVHSHIKKKTHRVVRRTIRKKPPAEAYAPLPIRPYKPLFATTVSNSLPPLRENLSLLNLGEIGPAPTIAITGPEAVAPEAVFAQIPHDKPGTVLFSPLGSLGGPSVGAASAAAKNLAPFVIPISALLGAVADNHSNGGDFLGEEGNNVPVVPEPEPVAFATMATVGIGLLVIRARKKQA